MLGWKANEVKHRIIIHHYFSHKLLLNQMDSMHIEEECSEVSNVLDLSWSTGGLSCPNQLLGFMLPCLFLFSCGENSQSKTNLFLAYLVKGVLSL